MKDCKDAIRWTHKNGANYGLDTSRIGLWGSSAGAHLSLFSAYTDNDSYQGDPDLTSFSSKVNYVIDNFGPSNLIDLFIISDFTAFSNLQQTDPQAYQKSKDFISDIFGLNAENNFTLSQQYAREFSPIQYINDETPPTLIMHGSADNVVNIIQSSSLRDSLNVHTIENEYYEYQNVKHGFDNANNSQLDDVTDRIVNFVKNH